MAAKNVPLKINHFQEIGRDIDDKRNRLAAGGGKNIIPISSCRWPPSRSVNTGRLYICTTCEQARKHLAGPHVNQPVHAQSAQNKVAKVQVIGNNGA